MGEGRKGCVPRLPSATSEGHEMGLKKKSSKLFLRWWANSRWRATAEPISRAIFSLVSLGEGRARTGVLLCPGRWRGALRLRTLYNMQRGFRTADCQGLFPFRPITARLSPEVGLYLETPRWRGPDAKTRLNLTATHVKDADGDLTPRGRRSRSLARFKGRARFLGLQSS